MPQRTIGTTEVVVSEISVDTTSLARSARMPEDLDRALRGAVDLGVSTFVVGPVPDAGGDSAGTLVAALAAVRADIVVAADIDVQDEWSRDAVMRGIERVTSALATDRIDVLQVADPGMDVMQDEAFWEMVRDLKDEGTVRAFGPSVRPGRSARNIAMFAIEHRAPDFLGHAHNMIEQDPGREITEAAADRDISLLVRTPLASGVLGGVTTAADDFTSPRIETWAEDGRAKVEALQFLLDDREGATMAQVALKWLLAEPAVASVVVDVASLDQLRELVAAPNVEEFDADELGEIDQLFRLGYGLPDRGVDGRVLTTA